MYEPIEFIYDRTQKDVDLAYEEIKDRYKTETFKPKSKAFIRKTDLKRYFNAIYEMAWQLSRNYGLITGVPAQQWTEPLIQRVKFELNLKTLNTIQNIFNNSKVTTKHKNIINFLEFTETNLFEEYIHLIYNVSFKNFTEQTKKCGAVISGQSINLPIKS